MLCQTWFADVWRRHGHEVVTAGLKDHFDYKIDSHLRHIDDVIQKCGLTGNPDVIIYSDDSYPVSVTGLERTSIPTIFYSVDAHHHLSWHKYFAAMFDLVLVAQKDYVQYFSEQGLEAKWLPLWATESEMPSEQKQYGALFIGTLNKKFNEERVEFFEKLSKIAPVTVKEGGWKDEYPLARIVMNQTVRGDLNFRVFEAMSSGSLLLTERSENGLFNLFEEGKHFACYERGNADEAAAKINYYLAHPKECRRIGLAGYDEIVRAHREEHRAATVLEYAVRLTKRHISHRFLSAVVPYVHCAWRYEKVSQSHGLLCFTTALEALQLGLSRGEVPTDHHLLYAILACIEHDRMSHNTNGYSVLKAMQERFPENQMLRLCLARVTLNLGMEEAATEYVKEFNMPPLQAFEMAEQVVRHLFKARALKEDYPEAYSPPDKGL